MTPRGKRAPLTFCVVKGEAPQAPSPFFFVASKKFCFCPTACNPPKKFLVFWTHSLKSVSKRDPDQIITAIACDAFPPSQKAAPAVRTHNLMPSYTKFRFQLVFHSSLCNPVEMFSRCHSSQGPRTLKERAKPCARFAYYFQAQDSSPRTNNTPAPLGRYQEGLRFGATETVYRRPPELH